MMAGDEVLIERCAGAPVAAVTINRPAKRNACDRAAWPGLRLAFEALAAAIRRAEDSADIREGARACAEKRPPRFAGR